MEEKIDWDLHDIASKINAQVVAITAVLNDAWRNELNTFWTRFKLKIAFSLAALGGNKEFMEKHENEVYTT